MVSCALFILGPLSIHILTQACRGEELSREAVLSWFRERVLEGLGLEEPPKTTVLGPYGDMAQPQARHAPRRAPRTSRTAWVNHGTSPNQEMSQIILFPSSGKGATANSSAQLFILTSAQQLLQAAEDPTKTSSDGWTTYHLDQNLLASVAEGPYLLQVRCSACQCHANEPDKTPFLHLHAQPRGPVRSPRRAPVTIPWSPSAIDLLQRPSQERPQHSDCHRAQIEISFEELGWDNWIVHPKVLTFYYCHGNCSTWDRTTAMLGITQCCAPVPGTMKSLRITTTSDGGYSFKYETLPNIILEECTCI
ncbi:inhibin alpha chain isoform X2 [Siniperca chuatsi]|uniref:inhibin alpha chain isoform X2 n=1 Tax=Siniperca chuatsi TaxID=119488 RepID=UPI001CE07746|nr:inhibin alpha chain isoform X2 [Siniperca chuatsi]